MKKRVVIIGGGVIGLGCGVKLSEYFKESVEITIITEEISPNTTGNVAAGLCIAFMLSGTPREKIRKWSKETFNLYHNFWKHGQAFEIGISLLPMIRLTTNAKAELTASEISYGFDALSPIELDKYSKEHGTVYNKGVRYVTYTCETYRLLEYLMKRFISAGGVLIRKRIDSLEDIPIRGSISDNGYDIIINCTGIAAKQLVDDEDLKPARGQVIRVNAPWITKVIATDSHYVVPNLGSIVLGNINQVNDYNTNVAIKDRQCILNGCEKLVPTLKSSEIVAEMTGIRPGRSGVRLEEELYKKKNGSSVKIIHNYGHGGSGFTLFWGCAGEVLDILIKSFDNIYTSKL